MSVYDVLKEKLDNEMREFKNSYRTMAAEQIYNDWYVISFMEEYYGFLTSDFVQNRFNEKELAWMVSLEKPLDFLYDKWQGSDGTTHYDWDVMSDFVWSIYYDEKRHEKQDLHNEIKTLDIKVIENTADDYFDKFDFRSHISHNPVVFNSGFPKHFDHEINERFEAFIKENVLVKSCDYGCDTYPNGILKEVAPGNFQSYQQQVWNFIEAVEQMFDCKCTYYNKVNGFEFVIEFGEGDNKGCYVFGAGNNGQEYSQCLYFKNPDQLNNVDFVKNVKTIDKALYTLLEEYDLCLMPKEQEASLEDKIAEAKIQKVEEDLKQISPTKNNEQIR